MNESAVTYASAKYSSPTQRGIGNLLDSLPGTGPRTLLGALAMVVGITFWLQPDRPSTSVPTVNKALGAEPVVEPDPVVTRDVASDESETPRVGNKTETKIEAKAASVLP